jgi:hypothetical protein
VEWFIKMGVGIAIVWVKNVKFTVEQAIRPRGEYRYSCTLSLTSVLDRGWWSMPRLSRFTPGKDPVPIVWEAGWAPGPVAYPGIFFGGLHQEIFFVVVGVQQIQLRIEGRENGDLGAVAP